jgi:hypothetical protein
VAVVPFVYYVVLFFHVLQHESNSLFFTLNSLGDLKKKNLDALAQDSHHDECVINQA